MSTQTAELASFVKWQSLNTRETKRGKVKHVVTGIPGPMFWKRYQAATGEGKAAFKALNATLAKVAKGQWEVVMWLIQPADDGSPHHIQGDAVEAILSQKWGFIGMHPPCTYLTGAGIHWNDRGRGWGQTLTALAHVKACITAAGDRPWYLENPVGIISTWIRKPDQTVQPYEFGEDASKRTCLWLNRLPLLKPTLRAQGRMVTLPNGKTVERWSNQTDSGQNRLGPSPTRWKERSKTYPGIAQAMAQQWSAAIAQNNLKISA